MRLFPEEERDFWEKVFQAGGDAITEIRMRAEREAFVYRDGKEFYLEKDGSLGKDRKKARIIQKEYLRDLLLHFCKYSLYAFEDELREGYLTLEGGHRLGLAGQAVMRNKEIQTIKNVTFLNLRICHQRKGMADKVLPWIYEEGDIVNTLILSPPGCGKTTLLRDVIRQISDGNAYGEGRCVGVVDERSEISGSYMGIPQNDLGCRTDVVEGCPKGLGLSLLLRSMTPRILAVDEVGGERDFAALQEASCCGVKILATMHGKTRGDLSHRLPEGLFEKVIYLERKNGIPSIGGCWDLRRERERA